MKSRFVGIAIRFTLSGLVSLPSVDALAQHDASHHSGYADIADREVKAMSPEQINELLAGEGMGMALPAELNGYPGPKHVLELDKQLELSDDQRRATQDIFDSMKEKAVALGHQIVHAEKMLNGAFAGHTITAIKLDSLTAEIAALNGRLRAAHLSAHLAQSEVLTHEQRHKYNTLRGYLPHGEDHE